MRDQLKTYVELLFAGNTNADDMKQEILQNTLDKYDDYIAQGKSAEAAYRLAISGIGDISEILGTPEEAAPSPAPIPAETDYRGRPVTPAWKKALRAIAVCLYILCVTPVIVLSEMGMETFGICGMFAMIAAATALMIIAGGSESTAAKSEKRAEQPLRKAVRQAINLVGICVYFILSFSTGAWYITWLVFPIIGAVWSVANAIFDLIGGDQNET